MLEGIFGLLFGLLKIVLVIFSPLLAYMIYLFSNILFQIIYKSIVKKMPIPKTGQYKKYGFFKRLFYLFPHQFVIDYFNRLDYEFREFGVHLVVGQQGAGKTITVVYLLRKWKQLYPHMQIMTNMDYKYQDYELNHWKDLIHKSNDHLGLSVVIDEIQGWFSSLQSKDFPPEMLTEISQQRKQRKAIIGTSQLFNRVAKPIREQTHFVYVPITIMGCLTIVRKTHEKFWDEKEQRFTKFTGMFFFVHDKELRESFDTLKKIEKYSDEGFKTDLERAQAETTQIINFKMKR